MNAVEPSAQGLTGSTQHAPAARASEEEIKALAKRALADPILRVVFESIGGYTMVLDGHRQIIAANDELLAMLGVSSGSRLVGLRPGEALHCLNATRGAGGCGTTIQCRHCGAVAAILSAQVSETPIEGQCTLSRWNQGRPQLADFCLRVSPLQLGPARVYVAVFHDITMLKWRELHQRMFLHDFANLVTGLKGWSEILAEEVAVAAANEIVTLTRRLGDSIDSHRLVLQCESGELHVNQAPVDLKKLEHELSAWFKTLAEARGCEFVIRREGEARVLVTDQQLLMRVLGNLIKNALEASVAGQSVTVTIESDDGQTSFSVHNVGVIPSLIAAQIFKQRFTTKGVGHGLGIYSVQVLGEQYLGGQVAFESAVEAGTTFRFTLPNHPRQATH